MRAREQSGQPVPGASRAPGEERLTERERFVREVEAGLADIAAGRTHTIGEVRRRLGLPAKRRTKRPQAARR